MSIYLPPRRTCGTMEVHERLLETDPSYRQNLLDIEFFMRDYIRRNAGVGLRSGIILIPVVVHVVYNTAVQNIADAQIQSQIAILNQDYRKLNADASLVPSVFQPVAADARIQFQLAVRDPQCNPTNGITRTATNVTSFTNNDAVKATATGGQDPWPSNKYLNLWICPLSGGLLGYAQFPGGPAATDGVVFTYTAVGNIGTAAAPFDKGRTATHEIGHWFNLHHIWGDSFCGDDFVADTPTQQGPNYSCPAFPHVTCNNGPNGDMFRNYMDYTDDACMGIFTAGQAARMEAALAGPRSSIVGSDALVPPPAVPTPSLWSQDIPADIGTEPDPVSANMWESDDIWVRNQNDGVTNQEHQNPVYRPAGSGSNYVYVRVRNRGCSGAGTGNVKLYWAKASTALGWPAPWDGSVTTPALMGGLIATQPTGSVAAGGFVILQYPWYPPNPSDYSSFGADQSHFCLLSRIETAPTPPFGMTFPEGADLNANVRNNNKIVWKNVEVVVPGGRTSFVTIGNPAKDPSLIRLTFTTPREAGGTSLLAERRVTLDLGKKLFEQWRKGDSVSAGVKVVGKYKLVLLESEAWIGNIMLDPHELETIKLQFTPLKNRPEGTNVFFLDVTEYVSKGETERILGGQRVVVKTLARKVRHDGPWDDDDLPKGIYTHWIHSHEEDTDDVKVYRPSDYTFPPSRGRMGFEIKENGEFIQHDIAPTDGLVQVMAHWMKTGAQRILVSFADPSKSPYVVTIVAFEGNRLKIRQERA